MNLYVHNALIAVKSKRTHDVVQFARMDFDDRPDFAKRLEKARVNAGYENAHVAAQRFGWKYDTYIQHERGERGITRAASKYAKAFRVSEGWLLTGEIQTTSEDPDLKTLQDLLPHISEAGRRALVASAEAMAAKSVVQAEESEIDPPPLKKAKARKSSQT